jgi:ubiquinone/menaquinone biosynthesis C-methylase UbiE
MTEKYYLAHDILAYYERNNESERLQSGAGLLEFARTKELVRRFLMPPPAIVLDIGGGAGAHAFWLARGGYEVHLRDPVARLVHQAQDRSSAEIDYPLASARVGDARELEVADESVDAVLLLGPLYHLPERSDRLRALKEAKRVLLPGGTLLTAAISRYASALDGLRHGYGEDPEFVGIVEHDLATGHHRNPTGNLAYFTTAYFHRPEDLRSEIEEAGFIHEATLPVEGPAWLLQDIEVRWEDAGKRQALMHAVRALENVPSLLGASAHLMTVARKSR